MLDVDSFLLDNYPNFCARRPRLYKRLTQLLRLLFNERQFKYFESQYPHLKGFEFAEQVLEFFDFSFTVRETEREKIPRQGRVVIVANHPIGSLDGLALLKLMREVRPDVRVVANDLLMAIKPLQSVLLPVDNMNGKTARDSLHAITDHLQKEGALIIFPAGEVSRLGAKGIRDTRWRNGFLRFASKTGSPIIPLFINARNSMFFYALSLLARPLSTIWLVREMFKQNHNCVDIRIGNPISYQDYSKLPLSINEQSSLFRRHLYAIGKDRKGILPTSSAIATPENRASLRRDIRNCQLLGMTKDNKHIYLYQGSIDGSADCCIMREIGRLREIAFRAVGEGTGLRRDNDIYDHHYHQLILWDEDELEIAGAYRFHPTDQIDLASHSSQLYSSTLFDLQPAMQEKLQQGIELGRSFVQPRYWGRRSLDYLWYGIGAFLRANPEYRYLFGPVTLSNSFPPQAMEMLVHFYSTHFPPTDCYAVPRLPYIITPQRTEALNKLFPGQDYQSEFTLLKERLTAMNLSVPTLYKQYSELCEPGGVEFVAFNIDPDFALCIDGLIVVDIEQLKESRRQRYLGE